MSKPQSSLRLFATNAWRATRDRELRGLAAFLAILLAIGTFFFMVVEGWTVMDSLYHSAMLITTVGNSDTSPVTGIGKLFSTVYVFVGLGSVLAFVALFAGHVHRRPDK